MRSVGMGFTDGRVAENTKLAAQIDSLARENAALKKEIMALKKGAKRERVNQADVSAET